MQQEPEVWWRRPGCARARGRADVARADRTLAKAAEGVGAGVGRELEAKQREVAGSKVGGSWEEERS